MTTHRESLPAELRSLLPAALHGLCEQRRYERGTLLFETGRRPGSMHFVSHGEVVLQRIGEDGAVMVLQRTRHSFVAEASLQSDRYHCDAVAVADANVTRIPRPALLAALTSDAAFALRWMRQLGVRTFPTHTYFFLADFAPGNAAAIAESLARRQILVKPMVDPALGPTYMRITTARPEDNGRFVQALKEVLSNGQD
jgi:CRP-like cAMP-binding protein